MRFHALRAACPAVAFLLGTAPAVLPAQTVGPLKRPAKARAADVFVAGEIVSVGAAAIRIRKIGGSLTTLRITDSTEYAPGAENLEPGQYIRVRAVRGPGGPLTALTIRSADVDPAEAERAGRSRERAAKQTRSAARGSGEKTVPPAGGLDDPGPPVLRRREPGDRSPLERRKPTQAEQPPPDFDFTPQAEQYDDPVLAKAVAVNADASRLQKNFICRQATRRFESRNLGKKWKELDLIEAEVLIVQNEGHYQELKKNGKATAGTMKDQGGTWSIGEYGAMLYNLFVHGNAERAERAGGEPDEFGIPYAYRIGHKQSDWTLHFTNGTYATAYDGRFWVRPESGNVTKSEMTAIDLPADYPLRTVFVSVDYGTVTVDGQDYRLPVSAVTQSCIRHSARCNRNDILFTDYRRFAAESSIYQTESKIEFGGEAAAESGDGEAPSQAAPGEESR